MASKGKSGLVLAAVTFIVGITAVALIYGVPYVMNEPSTISGQVTSYLLDDRGNVTGLLLSSNDQLHFSSATGKEVTSQIKIGDQVSAQGHPGTNTEYGRAVPVEQLTANGKTIMASVAGSSVPEEPTPPATKPVLPTSTPAETPVGAAAPSSSAPNSKPDSSTAKPTPSPAATGNPAAPTAVDPSAPGAPVSLPRPAAGSIAALSATGMVRSHLVNEQGEVDGLILSNGEQIHFTPQVGSRLIAAEKGAKQPVFVDGMGLHNDYGTVIRATHLAVAGNTIEPQTTEKSQSDSDHK